MGDILGIKFEAIDFLFKVYSIEDEELRLELFEKILAIDQTRMKIRSNQIGSQAKQNKKK